MATLIRTRTAPATTTSETRHRNLDATIPTPFPSQAQREQDELLQELETEELHITETNPFRALLANTLDQTNVDDVPSRFSGRQSPVVGNEISSATVQSMLGRMGSMDTVSEDLVPSILDVQKSCLTMLNDLLSTSTQWKPIIPDRRHSMPPRSPSSPAFVIQPSSALHTLVLNLRAQDPATAHASAGSSSVEATDDTALVRELQMRVDRIADDPMLPEQDADLLRTLVSLIQHFHRLATLQSSAATPVSPRVASWGSASPTSPSDSFATLRRQLSDFQLARGDVTARAAPTAVTPAQQVETALLWARVDVDLEQVVTLCHARTSETATLPSTSYADSLPPEYDAAWYDTDVNVEGLPQYEVAGAASGEDAKIGHPDDAQKADVPNPNERNTVANGLSEKMRVDLEAVALAIDRLYLVAPQLHDQRVELKKSKVEEMEKARLAGPSSHTSVRKGKQRAKEGDDVGDLEHMLELIGRASDRKLTNQSVVLDGGLKVKMEQARRRDLEKHEAFVEQLMKHSDAGRLHSQDAILTPSDTARSRKKDPDAMLSLPEFIREAVPEPLELKMQLEDSRALLSLPEFVKEPVPKALIPPSPRRTKSLKGMRSRSMSAPPLAWLLASSRPSSPGPVSPVEAKKTRSSKMRRVGSSIISIPALQSTLEVNYVAEYHESLQHVLVFLTTSGLTPGVNLEAEVIPPAEVPGNGSDGFECLVLKCGLSSSPFLRLPARVTPGKKEVKVDGQHYQIKLAVSPLTPPARSPSALLDATCLMQSRPTSYLCASCSLPLVQCSRLQDYRDLPSEHWAELVDAWMCHSDQKLHEHVTKRTNEGFWPTQGHAFVGGSYILFDQTAIVKHNVWPEQDQTERKGIDDWQLVRCICGAVVGRSREHQPKESSSTLAYRLAKYAIRPVSPTAEPVKIPLSAFVAEDMNEFVHAHATYRFVLLDEEEERPRLLIWLFKPSMRIAYTTPTQYIIPKSGSIHAAKVLFKILAPSTPYSDLQTISNRYPGFPQAEHLYYPLDVCRRLAGLLKESNTAYPEGMRTMTGLDVGWLQRT